MAHGTSDQTSVTGYTDASATLPRRRWTEFTGSGIPTGGLAVAALLAALGFSSSGDSYRVVLLAQASSYAIGALGLCLIFGFGGIALLGPSIFFAISAYTVAILATHGVPTLAGGLVALALTVAAAIILDLMLERLELFYLAIASVAIAFVAQDLATSLNGLTGGPGGMAVPTLSLGGFAISTPLRQAVFGWIIVAVIAVLLGRLLRGSFGRSLALMRHSVTAAAGSGIPVARIRAVTMGLGAVLIGLSGVVNATMVGFITPESTGLNLSLILIVIVVAGGARSLFGTVLATIIYVFINDELTNYPQAALLIYGAALVFFLFASKLPWRSYLGRAWTALHRSASDRGGEAR